jgi:hypothetical protein
VSTAITSSTSTPSFWAACGEISANDSHATFVTGSGTSCSHGRFAPRPSYRNAPGPATSVNSPSPSSAGSAISRSGVPTADAASAGVSPKTPPFFKIANQSPSNDFSTIVRKLPSGSFDAVSAPIARATSSNVSIIARES